MRSLRRALPRGLHRYDSSPHGYRQLELVDAVIDRIFQYYCNGRESSVRTVYGIHGGIHPPEEKHLSHPGKVLDAGLPSELILPLSQHIGAPAEPVVNVGDKVKAGQLLAESQGAVSAAVHAPTSGTVTAIGMRPVPHPSGLENTCIC